MFCPSCGSVERHVSQFCRACGTDLRAVRANLERPDAITASAVSAREEIGRALAAKIRELKKTRDLEKVAETVLPEIEKFLESPQDRRLRRLRAGVMMTVIGLGITVFFLLMSLIDKEVLFLTGIGVTAFLIGLGIIINGLMFTVPHQGVPDRSLDARRQDLIDRSSDHVDAVSIELTSTEYPSPPSIAEQTTRNLRSEPVKPSPIDDIR